MCILQWKLVLFGNQFNPHATELFIIAVLNPFYFYVLIM